MDRRLSTDIPTQSAQSASQRGHPTSKRALFSPHILVPKHHTAAPGRLGEKAHLRAEAGEEPEPENILLC